MAYPRIRDYFEQDLAKDQTITVKQRAILRASLDLFAEKGFDQTSTSDIAQRAGVAEGTVYRRYKTKAALRDAILAPIATDVAPMIASDFSDEQLHQRFASLADFLTAIVDDRLAFVRNNQKELKVIFEMVAFNPEQRQGMIDRIGRRMVAQMSGVLDQLKTDGRLVDWPDDLIIQTMLSLLAGYLVRLVLELPGTDLERQRALILDVLTSALTPSESDPSSRVGKLIN